MKQETINITRWDSPIPRRYGTD